MILVVLVGLAAAHTVDDQQPQKENVGPTPGVGTFDSRALAIAYYRSAAFRLHTDELRVEWEKAKAGKDKKSALENWRLNPPTRLGPIRAGPRAKPSRS